MHQQQTDNNYNEDLEGKESGNRFEETSSGTREEDEEEERQDEYKRGIHASLASSLLLLPLLLHLSFISFFISLNNNVLRVWFMLLWI